MFVFIKQNGKITHLHFKGSIERGSYTNGTCTLVTSSGKTFKYKMTKDDFSYLIRQLKKS